MAAHPVVHVLQQLAAHPFDFSKHLSVVDQSLAVVIWVCIALSAITWVLSVITKNYSWTDRLWSITPFVYAWILYYFHTLQNPTHHSQRLLVMALLPTLWGVRLTFNFYRKGGYNLNSEDYRWAEIQRWSIFQSAAVYQLFNIVFISFYQHLLLLLLIFPMFVAFDQETVSKTNAVNSIDFLALGLFLACVTMETMADMQQWYFQQAKRIYKESGVTTASVTRNIDVKNGFLSQGLFKYSRHPNFFAEICTWWSYYLFSVAATGHWLNWSVVGAVLLTLLFQGSTWFTEVLSSRKYPAYKQYQQTTSRLIPLPPRGKTA